MWGGGKAKGLGGGNGGCGFGGGGEEQQESGRERRGKSEKKWSKAYRTIENERTEVVKCTVCKYCKSIIFIKIVYYNPCRIG